MARGYDQEIKNKAFLLFTMRGRSLKEIGEQLKIPKNTIYNWSQEGKWTLLKVDITDNEYAEATLEYIVDAIDAYRFFRERALGVAKESYDAKELKLLVEIVALCDKQSIEWLNMKASNEA